MDCLKSKRHKLNAKDNLILFDFETAKGWACHVELEWPYVRILAEPGSGHSAVVQEPWRRDVTSPFPPSGNEGYIRNRDVPYQSVTLDVTSEDRRIGIPIKRPRILPLPVSRGGLLCRYFLAQVRAPIGRSVNVGTTHSVGLDNTRKTYPFSLEQERCGIPYLPEGSSEAVTHMENSPMHMEDWR